MLGYRESQKSLLESGDWSNTHKPAHKEMYVQSTESAVHAESHEQTAAFQPPAGLWPLVCLLLLLEFDDDERSVDFIGNPAGHPSLLSDTLQVAGVIGCYL